MSDKYILDADGETPIACSDLMTWAKWFENDKRRIVKQDHVGDVKVSTIFLGLNHNLGDGPPVLWETMIFGGTGDAEDYQERYASYSDAVAGHAKALAMVSQLGEVPK